MSQTHPFTLCRQSAATWVTLNTNNKRVILSLALYFLRLYMRPAVQVVAQEACRSEVDDNQLQQVAHALLVPSHIHTPASSARPVELRCPVWKSLSLQRWSLYPVAQWAILTIPATSYSSTNLIWSAQTLYFVGQTRGLFTPSHTLWSGWTNIWMNL